MLNTVYQLKRPRQFEAVFKNVELDDKHVLIRPTYLSICNADQRYYQGTRNKEILKEKLPMALVHEGIGRVICDPTETFKVGTDVIIIPNIPVETDEIIAENYLYSSRFCSSNEDGFLQEFIQTRPDRLLRLPEGINPSVAAFTELVSVSYHAVERFNRLAHARRDIIGVWGDGNLSFVTALLLKKRFSDSQIYVFGKHRQKIAEFTFADKTFEITEIPEKTEVDHAFECVGGNGAPRAISQIIDHIRPEGTISILGVTEDPAPINTRMILEKGLVIQGSSRSGRKDYEDLLSMYKRYPEIIDYLENIVGEQVKVRTIDDIVRAFEKDIYKPSGKTIIIWDK
ncbi:MAG TPA: zinc-binding dehydrogenase [Candidatus Mediterraneibacter norfolkensis]|nr:zinc-binding dehydrogenase [Candidatus Mediterraneibacter norfolkensis]